MESALVGLILGCYRFYVRGYTRCLIPHGEEKLVVHFAVNVLVNTKE